MSTWPTTATSSPYKNIFLLKIFYKVYRFLIYSEYELHVIKSFADEETQDIYDDKKTKKAFKRLSPILWRVAQRKLHMVHAATRLEDLRIPPANRLEALRGNLEGKHSIRINDQWRIIFRWVERHAEAVQIIDYHG